MATDSPSSSRRRRSFSTPVASQPRSRYITSNCGAAGELVTAMSACGGEGTYSCLRGACPVNTVLIASSSTSSPRPPASTTPASARTSSWPVVLSSETSAASAAANTTSASSAPSAAACSAAAAASCSTDTIVPGTVSPIDVAARLTACRRAAPSRAPSISARPPARAAAAAAVTSARPRRIWDRMTPELPRAPCNAPPASAAAICATSWFRTAHRPAPTPNAW